MECDSCDTSLLERVVGNLAHGFPLVHVFWKAGTKRMNKEEIQAVLNLGTTDLHTAGARLAQCEDFLDAEIYCDLRTQFKELHSHHVVLRTKTNSLSGLHLVRRYKVWSAAVQWRRAVLAHKHEVWSKSDWAALGLDSNGASKITLVDSQAQVGGGEPAQDFEQGTSLVVLMENDETTYEDDDECATVTSIECGPSDTDSCFGNPWLGYAQDTLSQADEQRCTQFST
ncbi:hypothetical protein C8Q78DRAFT_1075709 [Trametes maxima]|nr:hypothetical protein C8Q78DRAFT_1075709 [Trametes maxima]